MLITPMQSDQATYVCCLDLPCVPRQIGALRLGKHNMKLHWLVALFGWLFLIGDVAAEDATKTTREDKREPTEDAAPPYVQFDYCVERLLSPIHALAGQMPPDSEKQRTLMTAQPVPIASTLLLPPPSGLPTPTDATAQQGVLTQATQLNSFGEKLKAANTRLKKTLSATGDGLSVETLIATLPDPIDSGLVYSFETMLQALRLGIEAADAGATNSWFRDRSFLPWADRQVGSASRALSEVCRKSVPGVLLFRNSNLKVPRVLMVLVVGETPTSGVHGAALLNALRMSEQFSSATPIRIVGPTFSGTAYSLRVLLETFAGKPKRNFQIISGTASGSEVASLLRKAEGSEHNFSYAATTVTEADADCAYMNFLRTVLKVEDQGGVLKGVATLRESGTEFGQRALNSSTKCKVNGELTLSFPMHVSMLRDAYEDQERRERQPSAELPVLRANGLDVTLGETRTALELEAIVSAGLWIYVHLNRDPLVRSMSHNQDRSLSLSSGLVWRVFAWAILPLLTVAAAQFPNLAKLLLPLISPFLPALK